MIATVYGRTSKETDDAFSVSSQIDAGLFYAQEHGFTVPPEFVFREDHTGKAMDRPAYTKIRELIRERKVQAVIIYATDRLARKVSIGEVFLEEMYTYGVELHVVAWGLHVRDTPEDRLRFSFETTFSSFEHAKIAERINRGRRKKAELGGLVGQMRPVYGYVLNEYKNGYDAGEYLPVARDILIAYGIHHTNPTRIADTIQARNLKTPGRLLYEHLMDIYRRKFEGGRYPEEEYQKKVRYAERQLGQDRWLSNNVYNILQNHKVYAGEYTFSVGGKEYQIPVPAIITIEESDAVAAMLAVGKRRFARRPEGGPYLMGRRLTCAICGYSYKSSPKPRSTFYFYYRCSGQRSRQIDNVCTNRPIRGSIIDALARGFVKELLLNPSRLFIVDPRICTANTPGFGRIAI